QRDAYPSQLRERRRHRQDLGDGRGHFPSVRRAERPAGSPVKTSRLGVLTPIPLRGTDLRYGWFGNRHAAAQTPRAMIPLFAVLLATLAAASHAAAVDCPRNPGQGPRALIFKASASTSDLDFGWTGFAHNLAF